MIVTQPSSVGSRATSVAPHVGPAGGSDPAAVPRLPDVRQESIERFSSAVGNLDGQHEPVGRYFDREM